MSRPIGRCARLVKDDVRGPLPHGKFLSPEELAVRRCAPLVPHAVAKCEPCGATLVVDPLPHRCGKAYTKQGDYMEKCAL